MNIGDLRSGTASFNSHSVELSGVEVCMGSSVEGRDSGGEFLDTTISHKGLEEIHEGRKVSSSRNC